jgi:hypothetical protein
MAASPAYCPFGMRRPPTAVGAPAVVLASAHHRSSGDTCWERYARPYAYAGFTQPPALTIRLVEAGTFSSMWGGRMGRVTRLPPQFGQIPPRTSAAHVEQNVHSNVHMSASLLEGGRSRSQHSQLGRNSRGMLSLRMWSMVAAIHGLRHDPTPAETVDPV